MISDPVFYALAVPAVILLGLAKGGFTGVSGIAVPLMTLAVSPVRAAAIILPILMVQDAVSVWSFRRTWDGKLLALLLPSAAVGIFLGYLLASYISSAAVELAVGLTSIVFGLQRLWAERGGFVAPAQPQPAWFGVLCGIASGFTSQVSHAGGPPFQMYVMPKRLPRDIFIGTTSIFFAAVNWMKTPAYFALGQLSRDNLLTAAVLLPLAIASTIAGVALVRRFDGVGFYKVIYVLMVLVGLKLSYDGVAGLIA